MRPITVSPTVSFQIRNNVALYGGFLGTETNLSQRPPVNPVTGQPSATTLSGDIGTLSDRSDNCYHVICNPASLSHDASAVLGGFVITGRTKVVTMTGYPNRST